MAALFPRETLPERLRHRSTGPWTIEHEAASALESQAAQIAALERSIREHEEVIDLLTSPESSMSSAVIDLVHALRDAAGRLVMAGDRSGAEAARAAVTAIYAPKEDA